MSRFLRRSPSFGRSQSFGGGWSTFPSERRASLRSFLIVAGAFSLAFLLAWENIYMDQLLSELQQKKYASENLRSQVAETRAVIQKKMMVALADTEISELGLRTPDVEQVVLLTDGSGLFADQSYADARLSSLEHVQRRILDFFVTAALARAAKPSEP